MAKYWKLKDPKGLPGYTWGKDNMLKKGEYQSSDIGKKVFEVKPWPLSKPEGCLNIVENKIYIRTHREGSTTDLYYYIYNEKAYSFHLYKIKDASGTIDKGGPYFDEVDATGPDEAMWTQTSSYDASTGEIQYDTTIDTISEDYAVASKGYTPDVADITDWPSTSASSNSIQNSKLLNNRTIRGIFGIPYQFMPHVDPRIPHNGDDVKSSGLSTYNYLTDYSGLGREYAERIVENMPVLFLSPGVPNFMGTYTHEQKQSIFGELARRITGSDSVANVDDLISDEGKYYTFEYAVPDFFNYLNPLCRLASNFLGIGDYKYEDQRLDKMNWENFTNSTLSKFFAGIINQEYMSIPFYIESETQFSESFGNDVGASAIASTVDSLSDAAKEAMFFLGYSQMAQDVAIANFDADTGENAVSNLISGLNGVTGSGSKFINNVLTNLSSVATGGKLIFPKIWKDSSFSHSYDVTIKLRSPDMDTVSIFLNVIVPYLHLFALASPRQIDNNPNGLRSPFLIRGIYKGFFTIDMGIITSMSVTRGDQGAWNADGIPTSIDVTLNIVDLYENISMTKGNDLKYDTLDNTTLMDYVANLCGVNIYTPEVGRTIRMWIATNFENRFKDFVRIGFWSNTQNALANAVNRVWRAGL